MVDKSPAKLTVDKYELDNKRKYEACQEEQKTIKNESYQLCQEDRLPIGALVK